MSDLTLIIPAKNEKESLPRVLDELKKFNFKKNIILEASDKLTIDAIKNYDCEIIYQDSKGYGDALKKGIETVETEFFCIFNADGSFNPKELDVMVNNAGIGPNLLRTHQSKIKDWHRVIDINQTGVFYCMKVALGQFLDQKS